MSIQTVYKIKKPLMITFSTKVHRFKLSPNFGDYDIGLRYQKMPNSTQFVTRNWKWPIYFYDIQFVR